MFSHSPPPPAIELRHLRYFLVVYEELHFRRAAERLYMSQPPLSQAIRKLEHELGVRLFDRTGGQVQPTPAGRALAEEARTVLARFDLAVRETRRTGGESYAVRIGHSVDLPAAGLLRFREAFDRRYPDVDTQFSHLPAAEQVDRLSRGELDLGILPYYLDPDDVEQAVLFPGERLVAYLRPDDPLARKDVLTPRDLQDVALVSRHAKLAPVYARVLRELERIGYRFAEVAEAPGPHVRDVLLGVAAGRGVAILPSSYFKANAMIAERALDPSPTGPDTVLAWAVETRSIPDGGAGLRELARGLRAG